MSRSRVITIVIVILLVVFVVLAIYNFFLKDNRPVPATIESFFANPEDLSTGPSTTSQDEILTLVAPGIISFDLVDDTDILTVSSRGRIQRYGKAGFPPGVSAPSQLEPVIGAGANQVTGEVLLLSTGREPSGTWYLFSPTDQKLESLSPAVTGVAFSPQGQIASIEEDAEGSRVIVKNGGASRTVFSGKIPDLEASWVNERTLALSTAPSGMAPGILYLLDTGSRRITPLLGNRYGLTALVSPDGRWAVFSETGSNGKQLILKALETASGQERALGLTTLPEKCVFSQANKDVVYCATFSADPRTQVMPDDYRKDVFQNSKSDVARLNLETGETTTLHKDLPVDPVSPKLSNDEQFLFFINKRDGHLYRLEI